MVVDAAVTSIGLNYSLLIHFVLVVVGFIFMVFMMVGDVV
jgi:hypothetical protein